MYDLRQRARNNRANGNRPSYPPTPAEIYASDSPTPENQQGTIEQSKGISISNVKSSISEGKVTTQESQSATQDMKRLMEIKGLQVMQKNRSCLNSKTKTITR